MVQVCQFYLVVSRGHIGDEIVYFFGGQLSQIISCRPPHMPGDIYTVVSKIYHGLMWVNNIEIEKTANNPPHGQLHAPSIPVGGSDKPKSEMRNEE